MLAILKHAFSRSLLPAPWQSATRGGAREVLARAASDLVSGTCDKPRAARGLPFASSLSSSVFSESTVVRLSASFTGSRA